MTKVDLTAWLLANGWQTIDGHPSLTKPNAPNAAIVRMVLKTTVASLEIKKPAGKWEKVASESYSKIEPDPESGMPGGLGLGTITGLQQLMRDNKDRAAFSKIGAPRP
ncbi:MAG TPA: hypothetical protein VGV14_14715 [Rhodanobacter sp.]|nr:hypothetical protein [Rhodanobacter sp.]